MQKIGGMRRRKDAPRPRDSVRGVTLVELMVTLVVLAVLMAIAAPSFEMVRNSTRLSGQANELVTAIQLARSAAVSHRQWVTVCRSDDGATCSTATTPWRGWLVYVDMDRDSTLDAGEETLRIGEVRAPLSVLASNSLTNNLITFRPDGFARSGTSLLNATLSVCIPTTKPADNRRQVPIATGSRVAVQAVNGNGTCAAP